MNEQKNGNICILPRRLQFQIKKLKKDKYTNRKINHWNKHVKEQGLGKLSKQVKRLWFLIRKRSSKYRCLHQLNCA